MTKWKHQAFRHQQALSGLRRLIPKPPQIAEAEEQGYKHKYLVWERQVFARKGCVCVYKNLSNVEKVLPKGSLLNC